MVRHSCCTKPKLKKGLWSPEEDEKLFNHITRFGVGCWSSVPKLAGIPYTCSSFLQTFIYLFPFLKIKDEVFFHFFSFLKIAQFNGMIT